MEQHLVRDIEQSALFVQRLQHGLAVGIFGEAQKAQHHIATGYGVEVIAKVGRRPANNHGAGSPTDRGWVRYSIGLGSNFFCYYFRSCLRPYYMGFKPFLLKSIIAGIQSGKQHGRKTELREIANAHRVNSKKGLRTM